jgi:hypothetical protein
MVVKSMSFNVGVYKFPIGFLAVATASIAIYFSWLPCSQSITVCHSSMEKLPKQYLTMSFYCGSLGSSPSRAQLRTHREPIENHGKEDPCRKEIQAELILLSPATAEMIDSDRRVFVRTGIWYSRGVARTCW